MSGPGEKARRRPPLWRVLALLTVLAVVVLAWLDRQGTFDRLLRPQATAEEQSQALAAVERGDVAQLGAVLRSRWGLKRALGPVVLTAAARAGQSECVKFLLDKGVSANALSEGQTPLFAAAWSGQEDAVRLLLERGATPNVAALMGRTPLHAAALRGNGTLIHLLAKSGADLDARTDSRRTALHNAVEKGHEEAVHALLDEGAGMEAQDGEGCTPLLRAVIERRTEIVRLLLEAGANPSVQDAHRRTSLHLAVMRQDMPTVRLLLEEGADPSVADGGGRTPLGLAVAAGEEMREAFAPDYQTPGFQPGIQPARSAIQQVLLARGAEYDVFSAAWASLPAEAERALARNPWTLQTRDPQGNTPLHWAAARGDERIVGIFLGDGADVNAQDTMGQTPLHVAAERGNAAAVQALLAASANANIADHEGRTPAAAARTEELALLLGASARAAGEAPMPVQASPDAAGLVPTTMGPPFGIPVPAVGPSQQGMLQTAVAPTAEAIRRLLPAPRDSISASVGQATSAGTAALSEDAAVDALLDALERGDEPTVQRLFASGLDPNARGSDGRTALHGAVDGHESVVVYLLSHGADPNAQDDNGRTPLQEAASWPGTGAIVQMLIRAGADPNAPDTGGNTPLHLAAGSGNVDVLRALLTAGCDANARNRYGWTPLHTAAMLQSADVVGPLVAAGADPNARDAQGSTPLHAAVQRLNGDIIDALIAAGADVSAKDDAGHTPIHVADAMGAEAAAEALLRHGSQTSVFRAAKAGDAEALRALLSEDPDLANATKSEGLSVLMLAVLADSADAVRALVEAGADPNQPSDARAMLREPAIAVPSGRAEGARLWQRSARPLHIAVLIGAEDAAAGLIAAGADVDCRTDTGRTPLHVAAARGQAGLVRLLLDSGADPKGAAEDGWTPLHEAAATRGADECVKALLSAGADASAPDEGGATPLQVALLAGRSSAADLLRKHGAADDVFTASVSPDPQVLLAMIEKDPDCLRLRSRDLETPLHWAARAGDLAAVRVLLDHGAEPRAFSADGQTPLDVAATPEVLDALVAAGADPSAPTGSARSPLCAWALQGRWEMVDWLIKSGVQVDARDAAGNTALLLAAGAGNAAAVQGLLDRGADPNARGPGEEMNAGGGGGPTGVTALHRAAEGGHTEICRLLIAAGADVNAHRANGDTVLLSAARGPLGPDGIQVAPGLGSPEISSLLLASGADPSATDNDGTTPLHVSSYTGDTAVMKVLLAGGAKPNAREDDGSTPLHAAVEGRQAEACEVLLAAGADVNAVDSRGARPLDIALAMRADDMAEVLREHDGPPSQEAAAARETQ